MKVGMTILMAISTILTSSNIEKEPKPIEQLTAMLTPQPNYYSERLNQEDCMEMAEKYREEQEELERQRLEEEARLKAEEEARLLAEEQARQEEIARQQEIERLARLEEERKANITRTYYTSSNVSQPSNLTPEELEVALEGTGLAGLGQYFITAEETYGVNGVFLTAIAALESGWGTSHYAQQRNNLFGYQANDSNPDNATYFSSKAEAIYLVGRKLSENYLNPNGVYYNGATPSGVNVKYCSSEDWATKVVSIMNKIMNKVPY